ncbi:uncharacterized protein LOC134824467 [Bolinopsis microptera]|uniref:uncharacterized protein LOC134824467 n=1 Tax=Bolinopsis microptera TaxID=2820187 RepID=UPI00307A0179
MFSYSGSDMMSSLNQNNPQQYASVTNSGGLNGSSGLNGHSAAHGGGMTSHATGMTSHAPGMTSQATAAGYGASNYPSSMASLAAANPSFMTSAASYMSAIQSGRQPGYPAQAQQPQQPQQVFSYMWDKILPEDFDYDLDYSLETEM